MIIEAKQLGIEDADILAELRATGQRLVLTTAELSRLKRAGAGPKLLKALSASRGDTTRVTPEARPASAPRPPRGVAGDRSGATWTPQVWLDESIAPATSTAERSFAVMKRMFALFLAYTNQGRYAEAIEYLATHAVMAETNALPRWAIGLSWLELARAHLWSGDSEQVMQSDQMRIGHLNTMRIIQGRDEPIEASLARVAKPSAALSSRPVGSRTVSTSRWLRAGRPPCPSWAASRSNRIFPPRWPDPAIPQAARPAPGETFVPGTGGGSTERHHGRRHLLARAAHQPAPDGVRLLAGGTARVAELRGIGDDLRVAARGDGADRRPPG